MISSPDTKDDRNKDATGNPELTRTKPKKKTLLHFNDPSSNKMKQMILNQKMKRS